MSQKGQEEKSVWWEISSQISAGQQRKAWLVTRPLIRPAALPISHFSDPALKIAAHFLVGCTSASELWCCRELKRLEMPPVIVCAMGCHPKASEFSCSLSHPVPASRGASFPRLYMNKEQLRPRCFQVQQCIKVNACQKLTADAKYFPFCCDNSFTFCRKTLTALKMGRVVVPSSSAKARHCHGFSLFSWQIVCCFLLVLPGNPS